jgi:parallel beta-helix repeat protein
MKRTTVLAWVCLGLAVALGGKAQAEGTLDPPAEALQNGQPRAHMKTLDQIEPRTLITQLPYSITNSGSYYLARPMAGSPFSNGVTIAASHVKLDLCGFSIDGGTTDSLCGVFVGGQAFNVSIRNGIIRGWGGFGVLATNAKDAVLADLKAFDNGHGGLYVGDNALIERCAAYGNGVSAPPVNPPWSDGIRAGAYSTIKDCKAMHNKGAGIHAYFHSRVAGCTASDSMNANGIWAEDFCTVTDCTAARNRSVGISVYSQCRVAGNTCAGNGVTNDMTPPDGMVAGICVQGNNSVIERNNVTGNGIGIEVIDSAFGNLIVNNTATKNGQPNRDYKILGIPTGPCSNYVGAIWDLAPGEITNSNPWANFSFSGI